MSATRRPAKPAANVARLSDGYQPPFEPFALAMALMASAAWLLLVAWRTRGASSGH